MSFQKLLKKTENGEILSEKEIQTLAIKLGLKNSAFEITIRIILLVGLLLGSIKLLGSNKTFIVGLILLIITAVIGIILFTINFKTKRIIKYLEALKTFYLNRFKNYEGFESIYLAHDYQKNGYLQNDTCILLTDGYEFYIFDDILKPTEYLLPRAFKAENNKYPSLKVYDQEFINKRPVAFKLSDINFYALEKNHLDTVKKEKPTPGFEYRRYTFSREEKELNNHCWLELNDRSVFRLSTDAISILRRKAKDKEREAI